MKVYLTSNPPFNDLSHISVPAGTAVEFVAPPGYRWRMARDGSRRVEVYRYSLRERLDWVLDVNLLHVIAAVSFVIGMAVLVL